MRKSIAIFSIGCSLASLVFSAATVETTKGHYCAFPAKQISHHFGRDLCATLRP